jgi:hypothetical protein
MRWVALPLGIVVLVATFGDAFTTLVMPRAARRRVRPAIAQLVAMERRG